MNGMGCNFWLKSAPIIFIDWREKACWQHWNVLPRWLGHQKHLEGIKTSGTLCAHQEWHFWGEWGALGKSNLLCSWFEKILTTVYLSIPNCKWSANYGCRPQDKFFEVAGCISLVSSYLLKLTGLTVSILNAEFKPGFALACGMMLIICSGHTACVGQVL